MGSVSVDEQGPTLADGHPFKHFTIDGLFSPSETCLPTALRADVLLTSWLLVLIRTREERQASFEWAYDGWEDCEGAINLEVHLDDGRLAIRPVWYSEKVLPYTVALHVDILVDIIEICLSNPGASIQSCMAPTRHDLDSIWRWCHDLPPNHDFCMQDMVAGQAKRHPEKVAIDAWDGTLTYGQIELYSNSLAGLLRESGVDT
ncbi:hypothetical protein INS49_004934 [Diaporthe citri]|uniref:uncharacterized protein n=1 Tax=Diaporthe citri TaxID=83186 RepID=UPI001C7F7D41|nr:uncharacterized protein INS49_004934 [Diaporthe citri]KAG6354329.1 hypothetical protein INS49_004934 [Diaporthe citri]